jgi:PIN domain nuclease of toxin-antitoxin system
MKFLLDTHLLLWISTNPKRLSQAALSIIENIDNELFYSAGSLWEIVIKNSLGRDDFSVDTHQIRRGLIDNGYQELPITSEHTMFIAHLPPLHKDPFDRLMIAQATVEGMCLLTTDKTIAEYAGPVKLI